MPRRTGKGQADKDRVGDTTEAQQKWTTDNMSETTVVKTGEIPGTKLRREF